MGSLVQLRDATEWQYIRRADDPTRAEQAGAPRPARRRRFGRSGPRAGLLQRRLCGPGRQRARRGDSPVNDLRRAFTAFYAAFSDTRHSVDDLVADGDRVAARISVEAR